MIALGEQHLHERAPQAVQFLGIALHLDTRTDRRRAGCHHAAADARRAHLAAAVRLEFGVVAEVRNVAARGERGLQHCLARLEGDLLAIQQESLPTVHSCFSR
jgi:hypothetical protein